MWEKVKQHHASKNTARRLLGARKRGGANLAQPEQALSFITDLGTMTEERAGRQAYSSLPAAKAVFVLVAMIIRAASFNSLIPPLGKRGREEEDHTGNRSQPAGATKNAKASGRCVEGGPRFFWLVDWGMGELQTGFRQRWTKEGEHAASDMCA